MEDLYERSVNMFRRMPGLAGTTPWVLKDFRSPRRQMVGIQDDFNRKGLISDQGGKKKAYFGIGSGILPENTLRRPVIAGRFFSVPVAEFSRNFVSCRMDRETEYA